MFQFPNIQNLRKNAAIMRILTHTPHMCVCQTRSSSKCLPSLLVKANSFLVPLRSKVQTYSKKTAPPNLSIYMYVICHIYLNNCHISNSYDSTLLPWQKKNSLSEKGFKRFCEARIPIAANKSDHNLEFDEPVFF